jgi:M6 family metalloprotease-like protein
MKHRLLIAILGLFLTTFLSARPIKPIVSTITQPDGSTFISISYGDEFVRIITTEQGNAIVRDSDGWWCYAIYNSDGTKYSSGHHVGAGAPAGVITGSLSIPYEALAERARAMRNPAGLEEKENILSRVRKAQGKQAASDSKTTKHGIVILAQYSDLEFRHSRQELVDLVTKKGYNAFGGTGSAKDYFESQFNGIYEFAFDVSPIVTLSGRRAYYGQNDNSGNDLYPAEMIAEACSLAHDAGVDFSLYDDDGDNYVDNVFVFFAGEDEAEDPTNNEDCIWSHSWYVKSGAGITLNLDGKRIDQYACTSELKRTLKGYTLTGIGTFCHEFSHTLGLPDFYDTNYDVNGWAMGLWNSTSVMDGGNSNNESNTPPFFNVIEREIMGLTVPEILTHNGTYVLKPIHAGGNTYKIPSDSEDEYYLLECRGNKEWDEFIGGNGLLIYHIDKSNKRAWEFDNTVNINPQRQMADLIEADGRSDRTTSMTGYAAMISNISGIFFPYVNVTSFSSETTPGIRFRNGSNSTISITGISRNGENVTFTVTGLKGEEPPKPINVKAESFMDAAILNFESDRPFEGDAVIEWGRTGTELQTVRVSPYETGKYALVIEGLTPGNKTYTATICFEIDGTMGENKKVSFMTSREVPVRWPYIHFGKAANEDGTFSVGAKLPMRVYNAARAEAVEWEFNGKKSGPEGDGYFTVTESGTLKAIVYWPDGSTDILEKQIILSE